MNEVIGAAIAGIIVALLGAFGIWAREREAAHKTEVDRLTSEVARLEKTVIEDRLYNASLERENDGLRGVAGKLRDYIGMLKTLLYSNNIEIPESGFAVTKPLHRLLADYLEEQESPETGEAERSKTSARRRTLGQASAPPGSSGHSRQ